MPQFNLSGGDRSKILKLQDVADARLVRGTPERQRYARTGGAPWPSGLRLAESAEWRFDVEHAPMLLAEERLLAAGSGVVSDANVPVYWQRTVIREALTKLRGAEFVDATVPAAFAMSYAVPYSYRDTTAAGRSGTRSYEGQEIGRAGIIQSADTAYPTPQKMAFSVSDEMRYLSRALDWTAESENLDNAARLIAEDTDWLIHDEMLRASDEYGAVAVVGEDLEPQADGAKSVFVLAHFPVVRPRTVYDLQGNQVGSTIHPITVTYDSTALEEYDGTGTQSAGTYYVLDYNLGEISLVDEAGAVQTPADGTAYTISYSYASNVYAWDSDTGSASVGEHYDTLLYRFGVRVGMLADDRNYPADFALMSGTLMNGLEQADKFKANFRTPGTDLSTTGDLGAVKGVPVYKTGPFAGSFGDVRILLGQRGLTKFLLAKPWEMERMENERGPNGRFTGRKSAYGSQYVVLHTPTPLKGGYSSIVVYSATSRVAR